MRAHRETYSKYDLGDEGEGEDNDGPWPGKRSSTMALQRRAQASLDENGDAHQIADGGVGGGGGALPHLDQIQGHLVVTTCPACGPTSVVRRRPRARCSAPRHMR